jgi:hypothetical protein
MWVKAQNGRLLNLDHIIEIKIGRNEATIATPESWTVVAIHAGHNQKYPGGRTVLARFDEKHDIEQFLATMAGHLSDGDVQVMFA